MSQFVKMLAVSGAVTVMYPVVALADDAADHPLAFMFGEWVGEASGQTREGRYEITQTERVGPTLGGDIVVIEGRGYDDRGETMFNAFAVVSPSGADGGWEMRSYANGRAGTFPFELTETGYVWKLPAGPNAQMVYTATFDGDNWSQIGEYTPAEGAAIKTFEMTLTRVGDSTWPAGNPVSPSQD